MTMTMTTTTTNQIKSNQTNACYFFPIADRARLRTLTHTQIMYIEKTTRSSRLATCVIQLRELQGDQLIWRVRA